MYPKRDDWLKKMLEKFEDDIALVYGKQRGNDVTMFSENQIFKQWFPDHDIERQGHPFCNNANAAIRREIWQEFPYDEQLTGLEDIDWAKRVQEAGYDISYASEAEIVHVHDETPTEIFNRYRREAYAHKQILPEQSFSFFDFASLFVKNTLSDYRAALGESELLESLIGIPKFRFLQFAGTYRGFIKKGQISDRLWQRFYYPDRDTYPSSNKGEPDERSDAEENDKRSEFKRIDYSNEEMYTGRMTD